MDNEVPEEAGVDAADQAVEEAGTVGAGEIAAGGDANPLNMKKKYCKLTA